MAATDPAARDSFTADLNAALELTKLATTVKSRTTKERTFAHWTAFCAEHGKSPSLRDVPTHEDKLCYLLVFGQRYRHQGATGHPVRSDTVGKALQAVGEGITNLGERDPRTGYGSAKLHPLLATFLSACKADDNPASRSYPVNLTIIRALPDALDTNHAEFGRLNAHVIDLIIVAFYWLLRPAEYLACNQEGRSQAFLLRHVHLTRNGVSYAATTAPLNDVTHFDHATLEFTDQKNAVRGERVGHAANNDPFFCPVKALTRIVRRLRRHGATEATPLHHHFNPHPNHGKWYATKPTFVTNAIRHAAGLVATSTGIDPLLLSTWSLRPGGATAPLCAQVDTDIIRLLGRWNSDAMFRYLRIQATTTTSRLAQQMLDHGAFTFAPGAHQANGLPRQAPPAAAALAAARLEFHDG